MTSEHFDLCVIGGGINGAGIARDAAGRGLSVLLLEADDLASGTSGASTKLIHGGLRYLENYEFSMVRAALKEREILLRIAPHLIEPVDILIPHTPSARPRWLIRLGLFLYDHLGGRRSLPASRAIRLNNNALKHGLKGTFTHGFMYTDGWGDDTRLVIANALDAAERGATILTRTPCTGLRVEGGQWSITYQPAGAPERTVRAARVVNATGPWVGQFLVRMGLAAGDADLPRVRLVKGSHIIIPRRPPGAHITLLQQPDKRIVFVIPYQGNYTLIGTTEEAYTGDPRNARISQAEQAYLIAAYNAAFAAPISAGDIAFHYAGVRPLLDDGKANASKVTRDYRIYHHARFVPPMLSIFGGKLTTYRVLAEDVVDRLMHLAGRPAAGWTFRVPLPGGDIPRADFDAFLARQAAAYPWMPAALLWRYARAYGARMEEFLFDKVCLADLGQDLGQGIYTAELAYLRAEEWAMTAQDILWRRSKLGLHVTDKTVDTIEEYFSNASDS